MAVVIRALVGFAIMCAIACRDTAPRESARFAATVGEGGAMVSLDSALASFRVGTEPVTELDDASEDMSRLVERFRVAVSRRDTAALRAMVMTRREFAHLYYPTSPFTRAPTKQEPGLAWFLHSAASAKGAGRLLDRYGGGDFIVAANRCAAPARVEGRNVLWDDCVQTVVVGGDTTIVRLFGGIYQREGRFKIFSYANDL